MKVKEKKNVYVIMVNRDLAGFVKSKSDTKMIETVEKTISLMYGDENSDGIKEYREFYDEAGQLTSAKWYIRNSFTIISAYRVVKLKTL